MSPAEQKPSSIRDSLLSISLQAAIPLHIAGLKAKGGPNNWQGEWAREFADELGARGDILQFGEKKGEAATLFNRLAYAMAIMSFAPGGVQFAGLHFESVMDVHSDGK